MLGSGGQSLGEAQGPCDPPCFCPQESRASFLTVLLSLACSFEPRQKSLLLQEVFQACGSPLTCTLYYSLGSVATALDWVMCQNHQLRTGAGGDRWWPQMPTPVS